MRIIGVKVKVPQLLCYGNSEEDLIFLPLGLCFLPVKGGDRRKLIHKEMGKIFHKPIGSKPIQELAKGKEEIVILFDDLARPTPVFEVFPSCVQGIEGGLIVIHKK
jgi:nickel-dependent lactate racemase